MTGPGDGRPEEEPPTEIDPGRFRPAPPEDRATTIDAGRAVPAAPEAGGPTPTTIDPSRARREDEPVTVLDPGRSRPASTTGPTVAEGLPPGLESRFKIVGVLNRVGAQADVFIVQERDTGLERVLKLYRSDWAPDERVWPFLRRTRSQRLVDVIETSEEDGRYYEIMEYLAGGTLEKLRRDNPAGLDPLTLTEVVRQLVEGIAEMHAEEIIHRDLKPANVVVRSLTPFDVAIVDFGISQYVPDLLLINPGERSGTPPYAPPELIAGGMLSAALDWWSLGVTLLELSTGRPVLEGLDDLDVMRVTIATTPLNVSAVADPRIRLLCRGLLVQSPTERWGLDQIRRWLAGESPEASSAFAPAGRVSGAEAPFTYLGVPYVNRDLLAIAMTTTWETAADLFFNGGPEPLEELDEWLRQFPDPVRRPRRRRRAPVDVRLFDLLRAVDPGQPPVYRNENIAVSRLPELARRAMNAEGNSAAVVNEVRDYDLLPQLAVGSPAPGVDGGGGLLRIRARWAEEELQWRNATRLVTDDDARAELRRLGGRQAAIWLYAAVATESDRNEIRRVLNERERALNVPWFTALVAQPDAMWVAYRLIPAAVRVADRRADEERAASVRREWLRRTEALREWSRRQNRPQALARAVSGVAAMASVFVLLILASDIFGIASASTVVDGWFAAVASIAVVLAAESLLAWEIGGLYHPRYSLLGAGMIGAGRLARMIVGRGISLLVLLGCVLVAGVLTAFLPYAIPFAAAALTSAWAVVRFLRWRDDAARDREDIARSAEEERAGRTEPAATGARP